MVDVRFERVIALPSPTLPNTLYFVKPSDAQAVFLYATDVNGRALPIEQGQALSNAMLIERLSAVEYKLDLLLAGGGIVIPDPQDPPIITSPAGINSDGTPQVGETFTGVDPVGNGPVVARRWIAGGSTVAATQTYTAQAAGSLRFEADLRGPDNTIATSGSTITVTAAPVTPTLDNTDTTSTVAGNTVQGWPALASGFRADLLTLGVPSTSTTSDPISTQIADFNARRATLEGTSPSVQHYAAAGGGTVTEGNPSTNQHYAAAGGGTVVEGN